MSHPLNILRIDTTESKHIRVSINTDGRQVEKTETAPTGSSQVLLPFITQLLDELGLTLSDITRIEVHVGPGSYTGLRVGAAVANALGWLLHIPVNGKHDIVLPMYS